MLSESCFLAKIVDAKFHQATVSLFLSYHTCCSYDNNFQSSFLRGIFAQDLSVPARLTPHRKGVFTLFYYPLVPYLHMCFPEWFSPL